MGEAGVARFLEWVKGSPPARADVPVLLPGEVERKTRAERSERGVPIDDKTYADLLAAAESTGIAKSEAAAMVA